MYWYDINDATGALTTHGVVHYGVGDGPIAIHAVGDLLFIANQSSTDITTYRLNSSGSGTLVSVDNGNFVSVDDANPHSFADVSLSANESALYVAASNSLAVFLLNKTTGVLTPVPGSPFSGFNSPGTIKK